MSLKAEKDQAAYLRDMSDSAKQAMGYIKGMTFEQFWEDQKTRDAVAMRLQVIGEAAKHITAATSAALPKVPFTHIRGMRNRISHDYGGVNFKVVWKVASEELKPMLTELQKYFVRLVQQETEARRLQQSLNLNIPPHTPRQGPRMGM
ncbi:MAG: DUF86 domain-containing protein [Verrucomicrobia bacterium]|nr:DUF86 domain-containing protein [Verrucomicrobiota bacterium]